MTEVPVIWISPDFFTGVIIYASRVDNEGAVREHHAIWQHANNLLMGAADAHFLASCLIQLNRAVDFRDRLLNASYRFRKIPGMAGKKSHEIMETVGLVKPIMREKLNEVRNRLVHQPGTRVPTKAECTELVEFVWYFLKSTDRFAALPILMVQFDHVSSITGFESFMEVQNSRCLLGPNNSWKNVSVAGIHDTDTWMDPS